MASAVIVKSDDGTQNLVQETWAAFMSPGSNEPNPAEEGPGGGVTTAVILPKSAATEAAEAAHDKQEEATAPREKSLSATQVQQMLADTSDWKLLINRDSSGGKQEVLDRTYLESTWTASTGQGSITVRTRIPQPDEQRALATDENPGALKKITELAGTPATVLAAITTVASIVALTTAVSDPDLLKLAAVLAALAIIISAYGAVHVKVGKVHWSRLNEIQQRHDKLVERQAARLTIPCLLTGCALLAYVGSFLTGAEPAASAKMTTSVDPAASALTALVDVKWSDLDKTVARVSTTAVGGRRLVRLPKKRADDGTAKYTLHVPMARPGDVTVTTRAYDTAAKPVGKGFIQTFTIKKPG
jgi:hypothetical protein